MGAPAFYQALEEARRANNAPPLKESIRDAQRQAERARPAEQPVDYLWLNGGQS